jgi:hypothetical protein
VNIWLIALLTGMLLAVANFLYQSMAGGDWATAMERSYFQFVAVFVLAMMIRVWNGN